MKDFFALIDTYSTARTHERDVIGAALWETFGCERTVMVLDMTHFTRAVHGGGLLNYLCMIRTMQVLTRPIVEACAGRVIKFDADNLYAIFEESSSALEAAIEINRALARANRTRDKDSTIEVCVGIARGRLLLIDEQTDLFGDCVNIASKLGEDIAQANEILVTSEVRAELEADGSAASVRFEGAQLEISGMLFPVHRVFYDAA